MIYQENKLADSIGGIDYDHLRLKECGNKIIMNGRGSEEEEIWTKVEEVVWGESRGSSDSPHTTSSTSVHISSSSYPIPPALSCFHPPLTEDDHNQYQQ